MKNQISKKLGIDHPDINTGGDVQQALRTPSGNGGTFFTQEKPLHIRKGISAFVDGNDRTTLKATIPGRTDRSFDITGWSPDRVTGLTNFLNFYIASEKAGISSFLEQIFGDKGDATQDDHSIDNAQTRLENLGVRDTEGEIDFEV